MFNCLPERVCVTIVPDGSNAMVGSIGKFNSVLFSKIRSDPPFPVADSKDNMLPASCSARTHAK